MLICSVHSYEDAWHITSYLISICLSFMYYYTIHPIAVKFWEVVEYIPTKVPGILLLTLSYFIFYIHKNECMFVCSLCTVCLFVFYTLLHYTSDCHEILEVVGYTPMNVTGIFPLSWYCVGMSHMWSVTSQIEYVWASE